MSKETLTEELGTYNSLATDEFSGLEARILSSEHFSSSLPSMSFAASATYSRDGNDLVLELAGETVVVKGYFATPTPPALTTMDGAVISPELVASFLQRSDDQDFYASSLLKQLLNNDQSLDKDAIAVIESLDGSVLVIRKGQAIALQDGDQLFEGDEITTASDSSASLTFSDGTQFKIGGEARIALDQFSYESSTSEGLQVLSILSGAFSYISGLVAKEDPAKVQLRTPVGEIGIRGTKIVGEVDSDKAEVSITLLEGRILYETPQGEQYELSQGFDTLNIRNGGDSVKETTISPDRAARNYDVFNNADEVAEFIEQQPVTPEDQNSPDPQGDAGADLILPDISYSQAQALVEAENLLIETDIEAKETILEDIARAILSTRKEQAEADDGRAKTDEIKVLDISAYGSNRSDLSSETADIISIYLPSNDGKFAVYEPNFDRGRYGDTFALSSDTNDVEYTFYRGYNNELGGGEGQFFNVEDGAPEKILFSYKGENVTGEITEAPGQEAGFGDGGNEGMDLAVVITFGEDKDGDGVRDGVFRMIFNDYFDASIQVQISGFYSIQKPGESASAIQFSAISVVTDF